MERLRAAALFPTLEADQLQTGTPFGTGFFHGPLKKGFIDRFRLHHHGLPAP